MTNKILLDVFCGAGGCTRGYQQAGFYVVGVDIKPQTNYIGDEFVQSDALRFLDEEDLSRFDVIHASPPCQRYSVLTPVERKELHPDLIEPVRELLLATGKPYVIENVPNARHLLLDPFMLCGTMFGLNIWRHRYFETNVGLPKSAGACVHSDFPLPVLISGTTHRRDANGKRKEFTARQCRQASGLRWMTRKEMDEAIPPVYTKWIGQRLMESLLNE